MRNLMRQISICLIPVCFSIFMDLFIDSWSWIDYCLAIGFFYVGQVVYGILAFINDIRNIRDSKKMDEKYGHLYPKWKSTEPIGDPESFFKEMEENNKNPGKEKLIIPNIDNIFDKEGNDGKS